MESWLEAYSDILPEQAIEEIINNWYSPEDLGNQIDDPVFFVAEKEGVPIGFIHASVDEEPAHLHRLYLRPEEQRKGVGSELYSRAEKELKDEGVRLIELEVLSENEKGLSFYRKKGFEEQEEETVELNNEEVRQKILIKEI